MSGHSKWSTIKHQKGANDQKRGMAFTKLANAITIAVRNNRGMQLAIDKAKAANMPKDNIQRAIDRGSGKTGEADLAEVVFEGFGPENVAVMAEGITDNSTRTAQEVRSLFTKNGGSLGITNYLFTHLGEIIIEGGEGVFDKVMESGAEDFEEDDGELSVFTKPEELHKIKEELEGQGVKIVSAELVFRPNKETMTEIADQEKGQNVFDFLDALESLDDIHKVFSNLKIQG